MDSVLGCQLWHHASDVESYMHLPGPRPELWPLWIGLGWKRRVDDPCPSGSLLFPRDREIVPRPSTPMREENTIPRQSYTAAAWGDRA